MRGEGMSPEEMAALAREMEERALDQRVIAELERAPDLSGSIPADFAERVAAKVPVRRPVAVRATQYGRAAMWGCLAVLLVGLVFVAMKSGARFSAVETAVAWTLLVQFLGLAVWLGVRQWRTS